MILNFIIYYFYFIYILLFYLILNFIIYYFIYILFYLYFIIYLLCRPEFVRNYKKNLCPDAFSRFLTKESAFELNQDVEEATKYLHSFVIPLFSETLVFEIKKYAQTRKDLSNFPLMKIVILIFYFYFLF